MEKNCILSQSPSSFDALGTEALALCNMQKEQLHHNTWGLVSMYKSPSAVPVVSVD